MEEIKKKIPVEDKKQAELFGLFDSGAIDKQRGIIFISEQGEVGKEPFNDFLYLLRDDGIEVSTSEWIDFQTVLSSGEVTSLDDLYTVSRALLVKDPMNLAKFDEIFARRFYLKTDSESGYEYLEDNEGRKYTYDKHGEKAYFNKDGIAYNYDEDDRLYRLDDEKNREYVGEDEDGYFFEEYNDYYDEWDKKRIDLDDFPKIVDSTDEYEQDSLEQPKTPDNVTQEIRKDVEQALDSVPPKEIKDQLGTQEITENVPEDGEHSGEEFAHGGKEDQHNDILQQADENKTGGGSSREREKSEKKESRGGEGGEETGDGLGTGGTVLEHGKQEGQRPDEVPHSLISNKDKKAQAEDYDVRGKKRKKAKSKKRKGIEKKVLKLHKPKKSPKKKVISGTHAEFDKDKIIDYQIFGRVLSRLRSIINARSSNPTKKIDGKATVEAIAKAGGLPKIVCKEVVEEKPKLVVLVDVGGSVDPFRDIVLKLIRGATKGSDLDNVEVYYFHNAIYGYVWPEKEGNWRKSEVPIEKLMSNEDNTKVIVVGDAWMADCEYWDKGGGYGEEPSDLRVPYRTGEESFNLLKKRFQEDIVWLNPLREETHEEEDGSGSIEAIKDVFPMYELTYRGLEGAVQKLMEE